MKSNLKNLRHGVFPKHAHSSDLPVVPLKSEIPRRCGHFSKDEFPRFYVRSIFQKPKIVIDSDLGELVSIHSNSLLCINASEYGAY